MKKKKIYYYFFLKKMNKKILFLIIGIIAAIACIGFMFLIIKGIKRVKNGDSKFGVGDIVFGSLCEMAVLMLAISSFSASCSYDKDGNEVGKW